MQNKLALKGLCIFFAAMAFLTVIARVADSLLIANVKAEPVLSGALSHEATSDGIAEATDTLMIWAQKGLRVNRVMVKAGMQVAKGDALVDFDPQSVSDLINEMQLALNKLTNERAQIELDVIDVEDHNDKRTESQRKTADRLHKLKLDAIDMSLEEARHKVRNMASLRSDNGKVYAPGNGIITEISVQAGRETGGEALMQIAKVGSELTLTCRITRDEAKFVSVGDTVNVTPPGKRDSVHAQVKSVSKMAEDEMVEVIISLPNEKISVGMYCNVKFVHKTDGYVMVIPLSAVRKDSKGDYILVLRSKTSVLGDTLIAERVPVMIQDRDGTRVAIQCVLLDADLVITDWDKAIEAGDRVRQIQS